MIQRLFRTAIFAALIPAGVAAADFGGAMILYQQGQYAAAQQEFLALANEGDPDAQFILGDMYARGQGVTPDQIKQGEALAAGPPAAATPPPPPPAAGTPAPPPPPPSAAPPPPAPAASDNFFARLSRGATGLLGSQARAPETNQGVTPSLGIRGLSAEDLRTAAPNPQALQQMEGYQCNAVDAADFARTAQLTAQNVPYLQTAPQTPVNPQRNPLMH